MAFLFGPHSHVGFFDDTFKAKVEKDTLLKSAYQSYSRFSITDGILMRGLSGFFTMPEFEWKREVEQKEKGKKESPEGQPPSNRSAFNPLI
jgi:hypothetical protein